MKTYLTKTRQKKNQFLKSNPKYVNIFIKFSTQYKTSIYKHYIHDSRHCWGCRCRL